MNEPVELGIAGRTNVERIGSGGNGSRPEQPQRQGFVDPGDLRVLIDANC